MGIDDLVDNASDEKDRSEAQSLLDELGVDSREELEELDNRLQRSINLLVEYDRRIEKLEDRIGTLETVVAQVLRNSNGANEEDSTKETGTRQQDEEHQEEDTNDAEPFDW